MTCIGIDLGTTNSLVAIYEDSGPRIIPNALGEKLTPSVVGLADDRKTLLVGRAAKMRLVRHPDLTAARFKRLMGTDRQIMLGKKAYTATDLSAMVLRSLKNDAEAALSRNVDSAVITVPAYFNGIQRQATKDAAEIAGLRVERLINEPTAAALAAGVLDRDGESRFVVLDLGGGTFDVSILEMFDGVMEVRASSGDARLGGEDFTDAIARELASSVGLDWAKLGKGDCESILAVAEEIKRKLAGADAASAKVMAAGKEYSFALDSARAAAITGDLMARLRRPIDTCLNDCNVSVEDIDRVILVGGATRMAEVRSVAAKVFRRLPERSVDPDEAIALGAAVQAGLIARHEALDDVVMTDVAPFSLGIDSSSEINNRQVHNRFAPIIERNTILPASRSQYFNTTVDNQIEILVRIYQGESPFSSENIKLAELFVPVPRAPKGREQIEVRFSYDVSGLLAVTVTVLSTGEVIKDVVDNLASAMTPKEKARRLQALEAIAVHPRDMAENQALIETLKHFYEMLLGEDRMFLQQLLNEFELVMASQDPRAIAATRDRIGKIVTQIEAGYVR
ncbi:MULTISPECIES: Hsp70 family protein [unclassified Yoonia]|uniref:Hsp70 family protein n=1 Tax=unclassified Yoonia TaxID=2629118 RepID=UPI002AFFD8C9|nr:MULTISPECIES: Hsp70 family protein [unclassified Yoonia]